MHRGNRRKKFKGFIGSVGTLVLVEVEVGWHGTSTQQMAVPETGCKFVPVNVSQDPAASLRGCIQVLMYEEL